MNSSIFVLLVRDIRKAQSTDKIVQMCLDKWAHYMPLFEARIELLDVSYLLGGEFNATFRRFSLQGEPSIIAGAKAMLD